MAFTPKPLKGTFRLERQGRRSKRVMAENTVIVEAKTRDGRRCRYPRCKLRMVMHGSHLGKHRGMGGNPLGDRTTRDNIITQCAQHHQEFDLDLIDIRPLTNQGADGPCEFYRWINGEWVFVGRERTIHLSEPRRA